jgi:hypothetical protein
LRRARDFGLRRKAQRQTHSHSCYGNTRRHHPNPARTKSQMRTGRQRSMTFAFNAG